MKIDKTRFLMLTGAIATATMVGITAVGCSSGDDSVDDPMDLNGDPTPGDDAGLTDPDATADPDASNGDPTDDPDGSTDDPDGSTDDPDGSTELPDDSGSTEPTCLDDVGPTSTCASLPDSLCRDSCNHVFDASFQYKNEVSAEIIECFSDLPTCFDEGSRPADHDIRACIQGASAKGCLSEQAKSLCDSPAMNACASTFDWFTKELCETTLAGMREGEHHDFISCVTEGGTPDSTSCTVLAGNCFPYDVRPCLQDVGSAPACTTLPENSSCRTICEGFSPQHRFKAEVETEIVECLKALPNCVTEGNAIPNHQLRDCVQRASAKACVSDQAKSLCDSAAAQACETKHDWFTKELCETTLAGMKEEDHEKFIGCTSEGQGADVDYCIAAAWDCFPYDPK